LTDHLADLPKREEWDKWDSDYDSHKKYSNRTSTTDIGKALRNCLSFEHSDKHFFYDIKH